MGDTKRCPFCAEEILSAAIKCKHCGSALPMTPKAAATAATPHKYTQMRPLFKGMGACVLLLIVVAIGLSLLPDTPHAAAVSAAPPAPAPESAPELNLGAKLLGGAIVSIENDDTFDWTECKATINAHGVFVSGGFDYPVGTLHPGGAKMAPLSEFSDDDGKRFDSAQNVLKEFMVTCQTPSGYRTFVGSLRHPD